MELSHPAAAISTVCSALPPHMAPARRFTTGGFGEKTTVVLGLTRWARTGPARVSASARREPAIHCAVVGDTSAHRIATRVVAARVWVEPNGRLSASGAASCFMAVRSRRWRVVWSRRWSFRSAQGRSGRDMALSDAPSHSSAPKRTALLCTRGMPSEHSGVPWWLIDARPLRNVVPPSPSRYADLTGRRSFSTLVLPLMSFPL